MTLYSNRSSNNKLKNRNMTEYLEFTEFDDKTYSDEMENLADEYSVVGSAIKATFGKGHKHLKNTDRNYRKRHWSEVGGRISDRYKHLRKEDKKKKIYKAIKEKAEYNGKSAGPSKDYQDAKSAYFKGKKNKKIAEERAKNGNSTGSNKALAGIAGGVGGAAVGNMAASKWKKELAALKVKPNPTPEDLAKIKTLKRKIAAATAVGGAAGVGIGLLAANKYKK